MSTTPEAATSTSGAQRQPSRVGQAFIASARLLSMRSITTQNGRVWLTLLKLPNPNEFETGSTLEVSSSNRLGAAGDTWSGWIRLKGYPRQYNKQDGDTGETVVVRTADVRLYVVED